MSNEKVSSEIDVSVCIVNWNCRQLLRDCLMSLAALDPAGARCEIIVVDNASKDGAPDMVAAEFPEVRLIRNSENRGFAKANNQAAAVSRGRYLFFLNNDTVVPPESVGALVAYLNAHPETAIVGPKLRRPNGEHQISYHNFPTMTSLLRTTLLFRWTTVFRRSHRRQFRRALSTAETAQVVDALIGAAILVDHRRFKELRGWDESFPFCVEDFDLCRRMHPLGSTVYFPAVEIIHYGRASSQENIQFSLPSRKIGMIRFLRNAGYPQTSLWLFKLALSLDAVCQLALRSLALGVSRLAGRRRLLARRLTELKGLRSFIFQGLPAFWRA